MARQPLVGQALLIVEASRSHSDTPTLGRIPLDESQKPLPDNTQHSQETDVHASGWIRTRSPIKRAAADPRLRPRGRWDRVLKY